MSALILDGKKLAFDCRFSLKQKILNQGIKPKLAVILASDDGASQVYVKSKEKACFEVGIETETFVFDNEAKTEDVLSLITKLNDDVRVNGILVQLPLYAHLDEQRILYAVSPLKDVDGFHPNNMGRLFCRDNDGFLPCTPKGIMKLISMAKPDISGMEAVVVGRSQIVGKPVAQLLLNQNATVTMAHSKTNNLREVCKRADILVVAIGRPCFFDKSYIKEGAIVIDVGINRTENGLKGDVDFDDVQALASYITPVPCGVGPMTIAMLLENTYEAYLKQHCS